MNDYIEIRKVPYDRLQYRFRPVVVDASGAFCGFGDWGEWREVPFIVDEENRTLREALDAAFNKAVADWEKKNDPK